MAKMTLCIVPLIALYAFSGVAAFSLGPMGRRFIASLRHGGSFRGCYDHPICSRPQSIATNAHSAPFCPSTVSAAVVRGTSRPSRSPLRGGALSTRLQYEGSGDIDYDDNESPIKYNDRFDEFVTSWSPPDHASPYALPEASLRFPRGTFWGGNCSWHQTTHNVYVLIRLGPEARARDIHVEFQTRMISLTTARLDMWQQQEMRINTFDRLVPFGCFWTLERNTRVSDGMSAPAYLRLDLEKRYPLVTWPSLFFSALNDRSAAAADPRPGSRSLQQQLEGSSSIPYKNLLNRDSSFLNTPAMQGLVQEEDGEGGNAGAVEGADSGIPEEEEEEAAAQEAVYRQIPSSFDELLAASSSNPEAIVESDE